MIGIAAVLIASILMLVVFGAHSFRGTAAGQDENNNTRALGSYLSTVARYNDSAGAFTLSDDPTYGQVLLLADGSSEFPEIIRKAGLGDVDGLVRTEGRTDDAGHGLVLSHLLMPFKAVDRIIRGSDVMHVGGFDESAGRAVRIILQHLVALVIDRTCGLRI